MLDRLPSELIAGDTWSWSRSFADYPAPTWTATVYFENADGTFSAAATPAGSDHVFSFAAPDTGGKRAGRYRWSVRVASGDEAYTVESGWVDVLINPEASGNSDHRSWARRTLDAVEAFLEGNASTAQQSVSIAGRTLSRWSLAELTQWRDRLRQEIRTEEQSGTSGAGRSIKVRFGRAS